MTQQATALVASRLDPEVEAAMVLYERIAPLQQALGLQDHTAAEIQLFAMVAHRLGLDPFARQIYSVKRKGKVVHQVGIDGFRSVAESTHQYAGSDEPTFEACDCGTKPDGHPKIARTTVHRILPDGRVVNQVGVARWHELYPEGEGDAGFMWRKMPFNQLGKCSEAQALRRAFPRVLGGVYIPEEMAQADAGEASEADARRIAALPTAADRLAARRAAIESAPHTATVVVEPASDTGTVTAGLPDDGASGPVPPVAPSPAPAACGDPSPWTDGESCGLASGHSGNHRSKAKESWNQRS